MPEYTKLTSLERSIWAEDGDIENPSLAKIEEGWVGEEKPPHETFNWYMNKVDRGILYLLQQGVPAFDPTFPYLEKSYTKGSSGSLFVGNTDSTGQDPELDIVNTYWTKLIDASGAVAVDDISAYMYTLLEAVDASAAQTVLGGTTVGKAVFVASNEAAARAAIGGSYFTDRANHSGVQPISSVTNLQTTLDTKELLSNKALDLTSPNNTKYPTTLAVATALAAVTAGETYLGQWNAITNTPTLVSSVGTEGDKWQVSVADEAVPANNTELDVIDDWIVGDEVIFSGGVWIKRSAIIPSLTTDDIAEATNQYFTNSRVRAVLLTGLSLVSSVAIAATDTVIDAFGKLQAQVTSLFSRVPPSGGSTNQVLTKASGTDYDYSWTTPSSSSTSPVINLGNRAVSGSETVALDCSAGSDWNVSLNSSDATGTLTLNVTNVPSTTTSKFVGYIRVIRGGRKTISVTVPVGKTWNWIQGTAPAWTNVSGEYDYIMFYNMFDEAKIHAMVIDTGVL